MPERKGRSENNVFRGGRIYFCALGPAILATSALLLLLCYLGLFTFLGTTGLLGVGGLLSLWMRLLRPVHFAKRKWLSVTLIVSGLIASEEFIRGNVGPTYRIGDPIYLVAVVIYVLLSSALCSLLLLSDHVRGRIFERASLTLIPMIWIGSALMYVGSYSIISGQETKANEVIEKARAESESGFINDVCSGRYDFNPYPKWRSDVVSPDPLLYVMRNCLADKKTDLIVLGRVRIAMDAIRSLEEGAARQLPVRECTILQTELISQLFRHGGFDALQYARTKGLQINCFSNGVGVPHPLWWDTSLRHRSALRVQDLKRLQALGVDLSQTNQREEHFLDQPGISQELSPDVVRYLRAVETSKRSPDAA